MLSRWSCATPSPTRSTNGPLVWIAIAEFKGAPHQVNAGTHPVIALEKLLEQLIDGGTCQHCGRPTSLLTDLADPGLLATIACTYQYDPELKTYRRSCEGETHEG